MKFKVIEPDGFKHGFNHYENGNSHDSDNISDMSEDEVMVFHRAGWVSIDGHEDNERNIHHQEVVADNVTSKKVN